MVPFEVWCFLVLFGLLAGLIESVEIVSFGWLWKGFVESESVLGGGVGVMGSPTTSHIA